ncbi:MAG: class I SAM-dependent methyltransferase [Phycisphaerae bacterium]|jgi:demethylmenaquinone methyltransferase/2-methoxy-6-polyprenyl-1,4-benzoquinol methylase
MQRGVTSSQQTSLTNASASQPIAPHPHMQHLYSSDEQKQRFLKSIFDDTADDYDRIERILSLGSGSWYRRQALSRAGVKRGSKVIDVATGTGLVARQALALVGPEGTVTGVDPSPGMLRRAASQLQYPIHLGRADAIPLDASSADFVTMGYALRHLDDLPAAFREFQRVLKPGGRVCILEITRPSSRVGQAVLRAYLSTLAATVGTFSRLMPRTPELWAYYWETIDRCVPPATILAALTAAGFVEAQHSRTLGIFSEYTGRRSAQQN